MLKQSGPFKIFDGMTWPFPCERLNEVEWRLRYGEPTQQDRMLAASVMSAYTALIYKTQKERNHIASMLKAEPDFIYQQERTQQ
mgnify:CR=1 FL=1